MPARLLLASVAVGGALGAVARYVATEWIHARAGLSFPWGTLAVNLTGSLLLGIAYGSFESLAVPPTLRPALTVGFLGAFTTFSTFSYETVVLLQNGQAGRALAYVGGSVAAGLLAVVLGFSLARALGGG
jgi:CrcB protein